MKGKVKSEFITGIVFAAALAVLAYYTILVSRNSIDSKKTFPITVNFEDASGIQKEGRVMVKGVYSGIVSGVELGEEYVQIKLAMFNEFNLYPNYKILIETDGVLGGKQIRIYPGTPTDEQGNRMQTVSFDEVLQGESRDPIESLTSLIEENRDDIRIAVANFRGFSEKLNNGNGTIAKLLTDDKIANQTSELLDQVRDTVEDVREQAPVTSFIRAALTAF